MYVLASKILQFDGVGLTTMHICNSHHDIH
jgi:hypothetical protein